MSDKDTITNRFIKSLPQYEQEFLSSLSSHNRCAYSSYVNSCRLSRSGNPPKPPTLWLMAKDDRLILTPESEIATAMGITPQSVVRILQRARSKILRIITQNPKRYESLIEYWREL